MSRFSVVTPLNMLCVAVLVDAGCRVYDAELVEKRSAVVLAEAGSQARTDAVGIGEMSDAATPSSLQRALPACGNGRVDDLERCDVAIPQGEPGACPDGCETRAGCFVEHLEGRRCGARCEAREITQAIPGDGCCPSGATPETDSDCSATCGNGRVESGETCDPPESCPQETACRNVQACMSARFTGAPSTCSARCELVPIVKCVSGDQCCPAGCNQQNDDDCATGVRRPTTATQTPAGASMPPSAGASGPGVPDAGMSADPGAGCPDECGTGSTLSRCTDVHSADACEVCDCAYCADQVVDCEAQDSESARASCRALIQCATKNHCSGLDCYCGLFAANLCATGLANGPCMNEVRKAAGANDAVSIFLQAFSGAGPLLPAANVLSCRGQHCKRACGL